jgi:hypothetical protein
MRPTLIFIGGFLGAGKTTLILAAALELKKRGMRYAAILNDQSEGLVDTQLAELHGVPSGEVTDGCFCCRLSDLTAQLEGMLAYSPDVIFAEPVGSCTDISATVLHPLLAKWETYRLAPFTVLVDPIRSMDVTRPDADEDMAFLFHKQLQEADLVCVTKSDLCGLYPDLALPHVRQISAISGQGIAAWLDEVLAGELSTRKDVLDIDYERYAQAEAALAWLNFRGIFEAHAPVSPAMLLGPWLDGMDRSLTEAQIDIVHLKTMAETPGYVKAAICANGQEPEVEGVLDASPSMRHELTLNIRALGDPETMAAIIERELERLDGRWIERTARCFRPAAPQPERRVLREEIAIRD